MQKIADSFYTSRRWRRLRKAALERDHYLCCRCLRDGCLSYATMVHHIKPRKDHPELEMVLSNLESLCETCHNQLHPERNAHKSAGTSADKPAITNNVRIIKL